MQAFRARHAKKEIALFLGGGFLWDVTTLGRIDDATTLLSQLGYLSVLGWLLALDERWSLGASPPRFFAGIWTLKEYRKIDPLEHINGFTPTTLQRLAESLGFSRIQAPAAYVTTELARVARNRVKHALAPALKDSTQQYFRKTVGGDSEA